MKMKKWQQKIKGYLNNWKKLQERIKFLIPEEFYNQKNNYLYTALLSYVKFFDKLNPVYNEAILYFNEIQK